MNQLQMNARKTGSMDGHRLVPLPLKRDLQSVLNVGLSFQRTQSKDTLHGILFMDRIPQNYLKNSSKRKSSHYAIHSLKRDQLSSWIMHASISHLYFVILLIKLMNRD